MRLYLLLCSVFMFIPSLVLANIEILLFKKAPITKIYNSETVYLNSGDEFRFLIRSEISDNFELTLSNDSGNPVKKKIKISANEEIFIPGESQWYTFSEGFEKIKLSLNNNVLSKKIVLQKIKKYTFDNSLLKGNTNSGTYKNDSYLNIAEDLPKNISSVSIKKKEVTRSISGQMVYQNISELVVLISCGSTFGSGVVISEDGLILTNWHVIEGFSSVGVTFKPPGFSEVDPSIQYIADVLGSDEIGDLAVIKLRNISKIKGFVEFANESEIKVATRVHAIGHPLGEFWSYNTGIISNYRKNYAWTGENIHHRADVILNNTNINPGNSGGPLLNDNQKILGINSFFKGRGLNYAVSISTVKEFLNIKKTIVNPTIKKRRRTLSEKIDLNQDGISDGERYDTNDNGKFDVVAFDTDKDGNYDLWHHDQNENSIPDLTIEHDKEKGIDVWYYDSNEDEETERVGLDTNLDGLVDEFVEI